MDGVGGTTAAGRHGRRAARTRLHLLALYPKPRDRFRDRHRVAGAKDDRRDAFVLADSIRTDLPSVRRLRLDEPQLIVLRELSRAEETLLEAFRRSAHRFRDQLHRLYPQMLQLG